MSALTLFLALLLASSVLHKALAHKRLAQVAGVLTGLRGQGMLALIVAGTIELVAAACLLVPATHFTGGLLAALVWAGYALTLLRKRGRVLDCGCDLVAREKAVDGLLVARPAALAVLALIAGAMPFAELEIETPFAAAGLLALYLAGSELLAIPHPRWRKS